MRGFLFLLMRHSSRACDYNKGQLASWARDLELEKLEIFLGWEYTSGGSLVYDNDKKRYAYGVVMNTTARVEGQTKNFADIDILLTGYFADALKDQQHLLNANDK